MRADTRPRSAGSQGRTWPTGSLRSRRWRHIRRPRLRRPRPAARAECPDDSPGRGAHRPRETRRACMQRAAGSHFGWRAAAPGAGHAARQPAQAADARRCVNGAPAGAGNAARGNRFGVKHRLPRCAATASTRHASTSENTKLPVNFRARDPHERTPRHTPTGRRRTRDKETATPGRRSVVPHAAKRMTRCEQ